jgi:Ca2+-transporting ATPase
MAISVLDMDLLAALVPSSIEATPGRHLDCPSPARIPRDAGRDGPDKSAVRAWPGDETGVMSVSGLTSREAAVRLAQVGPNAVPSRRRTPVGVRVLTQLRDPLMLTLLAACALTVATGDVADTVVIAFVVVANTAAGVIQEVRADRAVSALQEMVVPSVRVRRDGRERPVPSAELVPGDVVLLGEGDVVPADGEVIEGSSLLVDESALTGESVPVAHRGRLGDEPGDELSGGTVVARGRAVVSLTQTGSRSALGRIAALTDVRPGPTPLQRRMAQLGRMLATVAVSLSALVLVLGLLRGEPTELMLVTAISLSVAAVPESRPCRSRCRRSSRSAWPWVRGGWRPVGPSSAACRPSRRSARSPSSRPTRRAR